MGEATSLFTNNPNLLTLIARTSKEIEDQITNYDLEFIRIRRDDMEWETRPPSFVDIFYHFVLANQNIPNQEQFWGMYTAVNGAWFAKEGLSEDQHMGLKARAYRTYPSLVRDLHFGKLLSETKVFEYVWYNPVLDIEMGIDLVAVYNEERFAVNLYTDTERARTSREKKKGRHKPIDMPSIEFPLDLSACKHVGKFYLYTEQEALKLLQTIKKLVETEGD